MDGTSPLIDHGRKINEAGAIGKVRSDVVGDGEGQPGLADPAGTGQRQQWNGLVEQECRAVARSVSRPMSRVRGTGREPIATPRQMRPRVTSQPGSRRMQRIVCLISRQQSVQ